MKDFKEVNAKWNDCEFGIDTDGKLKLIMEIEGKDLPKQIEIILAFNCLASIANQIGMDEKELYAMAFKTRKGQ